MARDRIFLDRRYIQAIDAVHEFGRRLKGAAYTGDKRDDLAREGNELQRQGKTTAEAADKARVVWEAFKQAQNDFCDARDEMIQGLRDGSLAAWLYVPKDGDYIKMSRAHWGKNDARENFKRRDQSVTYSTPPAPADGSRAIHEGMVVILKDDLRDILAKLRGGDDSTARSVPAQPTKAVRRRSNAGRPRVHNWSDIEEEIKLHLDDQPNAPYSAIIEQLRCTFPDLTADDRTIEKRIADIKKAIGGLGQGGIWQ